MNQSPNTQQRKLLLSSATLPSTLPGTSTTLPGTSTTEPLPIKQYRHQSEASSPGPTPFIMIEPPDNSKQQAFPFDTPNSATDRYSSDSTHYERNTTPYTSIEDIEGALERELSYFNKDDDDDDTQPKPRPTRKLSEPNKRSMTPNEEGVDVKEKPPVKRWHSFHKKNKLSVSDSSEPDEVQKKDSVLPFLRRGHSFSRTRKQRPISVIGLVHTSNSEHLVELDKALEQVRTLDRHHATSATSIPATTPSDSHSSAPPSTTHTSTVPTDMDLSTPTTHRKNRWSLLRTKTNRQKTPPKNQLSPTPMSDETRDQSPLLGDTDSLLSTKKPSRVTSLAREYSRKIKKEDQGGADGSTDGPTPQWLHTLKEKRRWRTTSLKRRDDRPSSSQEISMSITGEELLDRNMSPLSAPNSPHSFDTFGYSTDSTLSNNSVDLSDFFNNKIQHPSSAEVLPEGDGTLKRAKRRHSAKGQERSGWVKSLVKRFSGSKL